MQILYSKHHLISCIASNLGIAISFRSTRRFLTCSSAAQLRNVQLVVQTPKIRRYQTISNSNQPSVVDGPVAVYEQLIRTRKLNNDPFQRKIIGILQGLYNRVLSFYPQWNEVRHKELERSRNRGLSQSGWINKVLSKFSDPPKPQFGPEGLYLYGDVGTGKTMCMDLFYNSLPSDMKKKRVHFHAWMLDIHARIHEYRVRNKPHYSHAMDPIVSIASDISKDTYVLCFDELQVTDIADAMILRNLLYELMKRGVVIVFTSNRHPDELYKNGIQRSSFIPCIELLKERCEVVSLNSGIDYRKRAQELAKVFIHPNTVENKAYLEDVWAGLVNGRPVNQKSIEFLGRQLIVPFSVDNVAKFSFQQLCSEPLSAADYLQLVSNYKTIVVTDVPKMTLKDRYEARRFITLLDAVYESKASLIMIAETDVLNLFTDHGSKKGNSDTGYQDLADDMNLTSEEIKASPVFSGEEELFAFQRAISRLIEIQGVSWLNEEARRAVLGAAVRRMESGAGRSVS